MSIFQVDKVLSVNKRAEIVCTVIGSRPTAKVSWWLENDRLGAAKLDVLEDGNITKTMISLLVSKQDNKKKLYCKAENVEIPNSFLKEELVLNIECKSIVFK